MADPVAAERRELRGAPEGRARAVPLRGYLMEPKVSRDYSGAKIGMWLFLFSEICFFFGPLVLYTVFRYRHPAEFASASKGMDLTLGTINTVILLTSSLMAATAVAAIKKGREKAAALLIALTAVMGVAFLI